MTSIHQVSPEITSLTKGQLSARVGAAGLCADAMDDTWFPAIEPTGERGRASYEEYARKACKGCEVRTECLILALRNESRWGMSSHGIWGGTAPWRRRLMIRQLKRREADAARRAETELAVSA